MWILRWMWDKVRKYKVKNNDILSWDRQLLEDKLIENCLRWFNHIECKLRDALVRMIKNIDIT